jgi:hypothetical protein
MIKNRKKLLRLESIEVAHEAVWNIPPDFDSPSDEEEESYEEIPEPHVAHDYMHPDFDHIYDADPKDVKEEQQNLESDLLTLLSNGSNVMRCNKSVLKIRINRRNLLIW